MKKMFPFLMVFLITGLVVAAAVRSNFDRSAEKIKSSAALRNEAHTGNGHITLHGVSDILSPGRPDYR